jgi:hypothetical protein
MSNSCGRISVLPVETLAFASGALASGALASGVSAFGSAALGATGAVAGAIMSSCSSTAIWVVALASLAGESIIVATSFELTSLLPDRSIARLRHPVHGPVGTGQMFYIRSAQESR